MTCQAGNSVDTLGHTSWNFGSVKGELCNRWVTCECWDQKRAADCLLPFSGMACERFQISSGELNMGLELGAENTVAFTWRAPLCRINLPMSAAKLRDKLFDLLDAFVSLRDCQR